MSKLIKRLAFTSIAAMAVVGSNASAATFFVANPGSNSGDFQAAVAAAGGTVVTNADFETPTTGGTLTTVNFATSSGPGPGQGNTSSPPTSSGEGLYSASNYLRSSRAGSFIFTFTSAVSGLGFTTIDLFNPDGLNDISLSVFSGANGMGTLLGSTTAANVNFQSNFKYFMGFVSNSQNIGSFVVTNPGGAGDVFGVDDIVSANTSSLPAVPEPGTWAMMILGFGAVGGAMRRRSATAKASRMRLTYA